MSERKAVTDLRTYVSEPQPEFTKGDAGKSRPDLIPPHGWEDVAYVFGFGAEKHGEENWRNCQHPKRYYIGAALRHMLKWCKGEKLDPETGRNHLAHAVCSLLIAMELERIAGE